MLKSIINCGTSLIRKLNTIGKVNVDFWGYATPDGRSIRKAEMFLATFGMGKKKWECPQLDAE